jgi:hypothetical protein
MRHLRMRDSGNTGNQQRHNQERFAHDGQIKPRAIPDQVRCYFR